MAKREIPPTATAQSRFWPKVDKASSPSGCWLWTAAIAWNGYGNFRLEGRSAFAHRVAYTWIVGPVASELDLDHLCRVRNCVNPEHLEPVTRRENLLRGEGITAVNAKKTHCPKGHPYNETNTYRPPTGHSRGCRICRQATARASGVRRKLRRAAANA